MIFILFCRSLFTYLTIFVLNKFFVNRKCNKKKLNFPYITSKTEQKRTKKNDAESIEYNRNKKKQCWHWHTSCGFFFHFYINITTNKFRLIHWGIAFVMQHLHFWFSFFFLLILLLLLFVRCNCSKRTNNWNFCFDFLWLKVMAKPHGASRKSKEP